jgi:hypothetical protein
MTIGFDGEVGGDDDSRPRAPIYLRLSIQSYCRGPDLDCWLPTDAEHEWNHKERQADAPFDSLFDRDRRRVAASALLEYCSELSIRLELKSGNVWSQAVMNLASLPGRGLEDVEDAEFLAHLRGASSVKRGDYPAILARWSSAFPAEQLLVGFFEEIATEPKQLLTRAFAHVGVSTEVDWRTFPFSRRIRHPADAAAKGNLDAAEVPDRFRSFLRTMYASDIEALAERFGAPAAA